MALFLDGALVTGPDRAFRFGALALILTVLVAWCVEPFGLKTNQSGMLSQ